MNATDATSVLTDRTTLGLLAFLSAGWTLPDLLGGWASAALPLWLPAYLVSMVTYDGLLGVERVVYAVQRVVPGEWALAWDAGLVAWFYVFSVAAVALGRLVARREGRDRAGATPLRFALAAAMLLVGALLVVQSLAVAPTVTSETCTATAQAGGATPTATPECTRTTERATGQQLYAVGLGLAVGSLGAGVVGVDRWLSGR